MKKIYLVLVFLALAVGIGYVITRPKPVNKNENNTGQNNQPIGGQRDEHGCLTPAGYSWEETVGACVRAWEINSDDLKRAAKIAADKIGRGYALTIIEIKPQTGTGNFTVSLEQGEERLKQIVNIQNWEVSNKPAASTIAGVTQAFATKYNRPAAEVHVTVSDDRGTHARGSILFGSGGVGVGGLWFAVQSAAGYEIVWDGNGSFACSLLDRQGFPKDMQEGCY